MKTEIGKHFKSVAKTQLGADKACNVGREGLGAGMG